MSARSARLGTAVLAAWAIVATALLVLARLEGPIFRPRDVAPVAEPPGAPETPPALVLDQASWETLPGWADDDLGGVALALGRSCGRLARRPPDDRLAADGVGGTVADWAPFCAAVGAADSPDELRRALEDHLVPLAVTDRGDPVGLFTGYYEPLLRGSRHRRSSRQVPLFRPPPELVAVDLGEFREDLRGRRLAGEVVGGRLRPFADRSAIEAGALDRRGLELVWVDDPVDAFFLQIQGSGRIELDDGTTIRVGYAGQNGHPYVSIGRVLIERGELSREEVSMQTIRSWIGDHPDEAATLLAANPSFVFFRELDGEGPVGSLGVPLVPGRSLAVDRTFLPLGPPLWVDATVPSAGGTRTLRRLVVAQDTGGAIRGPVRGDLFWGAGDEAAEVAGRMKDPGRLWLLVPASTAAAAVAATRPTGDAVGGEGA